ncbi:MAG: glycosyltransferase family 2 protein [Myxococcales bacterium]|nr:MAG: glycosyltransferase family 2 protein [Myxococcales bacterium]
MRISVLMIAWNQREDLARCLPSLDAQTCRDFEAILVDNGSTDGSPSYVRETFPRVTLVEAGKNLGFAGANNLAAEKAGGDLLFFVNTDTELAPDLLAELERAARLYPDYDLFCPQMLNLYDRRAVDCKGMRFNPSLRAEMIGIGRPTDPFEKPFEVFGPTGGAMALRRAVYEKIGLFDAAFFFNNEDVDFALRAFGAGFRTLYAPTAKVYHKRSPFEARQPDAAMYYIQRNFVLAAYKNVPLPLWLTHGPRHLAYNGWQFLKWARRGKAALWLKAKWDALRLMPSLARTPAPAGRLKAVLGKSVLGPAARPAAALSDETATSRTGNR